MKTLLSKALKENQLSLADDQQDLLLKYLELMRTWNRVFNLTRITDDREMIYLHIIDSLLMSPHIKGPRCLDVGSGAGLPGIPLAIMHPEHEWTLLDKSSKKTRFLTQAVAELGLKNVKVAQESIQDFLLPHTADETNDGFHTIISRAFATVALFVESAHHLLSSQGIFLAMKGKYPQDELAEIPDSFHVSAICPIALKGMSVERHIVLIHKR